MSPRFLNVDLDLITQTKPTQIIRDFGEDAVVLASDKTAEGYFTRFEMSVSPDTAEEVISEYQRLLGRLSPSAVTEWRNAKRREFNFGYDAPPRLSPLRDYHQTRLVAIYRGEQCNARCNDLSKRKR
jgi:hypothetical protein